MQKDYYPVLARAVSALDPNTESSRRALYDRARVAIMDAGLPAQETHAERSALETAIQRIEHELAAAAAPTPQPRMQRRAAPPIQPRTRRADAAPERPEAAAPERSSGAGRIALMAGAAAIVLAIIGYAVWPRSGPVDRPQQQARTQVPAPQVAAPQAAAPQVTAPKAPAPQVATPQPAAPPAAAPPAAAPAAETRTTDTKTTDGTADSGLPYVYRRQMVYYRTVHPPGTIVISKSQRNLYLVRPNVSAVRYTIGMGRACQNAVGLLTISDKREANAPPRVAVSTGRPGGDAASRTLALGDTGLRIDGTEPPLKDGDQSCFTLANEDMADLFERIAVNARVVIN